MISYQDIELGNNSRVVNLRLPTHTTFPDRTEGRLFYGTSESRLAVANGSTVRTVAYADELTRKSSNFSMRPGWVNNTIGWPQLAHHYSGALAQVSGTVQVSATTAFEKHIATLATPQPKANIMQPVVTSQGIMRCDLQTNGVITIASDSLPPGTWVSLNFVYMY